MSDETLDETIAALQSAETENRVLRDENERLREALAEAVEALRPCPAAWDAENDQPVEHEWHTDSEGVGCTECSARLPSAALGEKP